MSRRTIPNRNTRRFMSDARGAALVEFGIMLPILLLFFAVIIESARIFWSYQAAITSVRDAARYVARAAPLDICDSSPSGTSLAGHMPPGGLGGSDSEASVFPPLVTVDSVSALLDCRPGATVAYRLDPAPIATLSADITIQFPFAGLFTLVGGGFPGSVTTTVRDESRIFGA